MESSGVEGPSICPIQGSEYKVMILLPSAPLPRFHVWASTSLWYSSKEQCRVCSIRDQGDPWETASGRPALDQPTSASTSTIGAAPQVQLAIPDTGSPAQSKTSLLCPMSSNATKEKNRQNMAYHHGQAIQSLWVKVSDLGWTNNPNTTPIKGLWKEQVVVCLHGTRGEIAYGEGNASTSKGWCRHRQRALLMTRSHWRWRGLKSGAFLQPRKC